ncbi:MAG: type II secretion system protein [Kiritimatiellae bacterium]|nr:type II secretion system protein [Kiritimatiellia bacterium]
MMKKGFTLVELMVVIVVIATLLAITFRIVGVGEDATCRNRTITRMQRLENALSGYFAAFGSYPPVALHASRNVYAELDQNGQETGGETSELNWQSVRSACAAQPVAVRFPFKNTETVRTYIERASEIVVNRVNSDEDHFKQYKLYAYQLGGGFQALREPNQAPGWTDKKTWQEVKIFQFGLMSFLLPRYLFMTRGVRSEDLDDCAQWTAHNRLSAHPNTGGQFNSWRDQLLDSRLLSRIPSQAVCARWMPNFEDMLSGNPIDGGSMSFFGVDVSDGSIAIDPDNPGELAPNVYVDQNRTVLDSITACDGWGRTFFYYSAPPYQSYRLWSAGPNGETFPPWVPLDSLKSDADRRTASNWMADDIMYLSN